MATNLGFEIVDSHQHFVDTDRYDYYWMSKMPATLHRSFTPDMVAGDMTAAGIGASVAVQAVPEPEETYGLVSAAEQYSFIRAVVGSIDLSDPNLERQLTEYRARPIIRAVRHQQAEDADADWLLRPEVRRGFAAVERSGLACDLLCRSHQLHAIPGIAEAFPSLRIILEHGGKPDVHGEQYASWERQISRLARSENVCCKLSELVTLADWHAWTPEQIRPYVLKCVDAFGYERVMWGSGWPVCLVASTYEQTLSVVLDSLPNPTANELELVFRNNALRWYGLDT